MIEKVPQKGKQNNSDYKNVKRRGKTSTSFQLFIISLER